jgi:hypothetical protein
VPPPVAQPYHLLAQENRTDESQTPVDDPPRLWHSCAGCG